MRWLLLNHNLRGHGTWHRAWRIARELARRGHGVEIWTAAPHHYYRPARETVDGVEIIETPSWAPLARPDDGWGPLDLLDRGRRALTARCDVVYAFAHPPNVALPAWLLARARGKPLLYDWCDWYAGGIFPKREEARRAGLLKDEPALQAFLERREVALEADMLRRAGRVTVISRRLQEFALAAGRRADEVHLLPNGASLDTIRPLDAAQCRNELSLPREALYVGYLANYHPDQEFFLTALARTAARVPAVKLIATGPPFDKALVERLGLREHLVEFGRVAETHLPLLLGASDALALPLEDNASNRARIPFKFTDYLCAGRPIATCRVGELVEFFESTADHQNIGVASEPTSAAYGEALADLLSPACDREAMGAAARRLAETRFAWARLVDELEEFLRGWLAPS